jgi:hypothetical protein
MGRAKLTKGLGISFPEEVTRCDESHIVWRREHGRRFETTRSHASIYFRKIRIYIIFWTGDSTTDSFL